MSFQLNNKIDGIELLETKRSDFISFSNHIKEKYNLTSESLKVLHLLSLEEMIALRLEEMLKLFNGKFFFPVREFLLLIVPKAVYRLIDAYPSKPEKRAILNLFLMNKKTKFRLNTKYQQFMQESKYDLNNK